MYAALWRALPGPRWLKVLEALVLLAGVVAFCFLWLFPRIEPLMPFSQTTVDTGTSTSQSPSQSPRQSPRQPPHRHRPASIPSCARSAHRSRRIRPMRCAPAKPARCRWNSPSAPMAG